jgi:Predicted small integral membrane protein (DUF2165)
VWFFGFMVVGGEWFSMWQSAMWNGQEAAFRFYMTILAVLIFVNQPDGELSATGGGSRPAMRQRGKYVVEESIRVVGRRYRLRLQRASGLGGGLGASD